MPISLNQLIELDKAIDYVVDKLAPATEQKIFEGHANYYYESNFTNELCDLLCYCKGSRNLKVLVPLMEKHAAKIIRLENAKLRRIEREGKHPRKLRTIAKRTAHNETGASKVEVANE